MTRRDADPDVLVSAAWVDARRGETDRIRIGERSSHMWFVLRHRPGFPQMRNCNGSWTAWGNAVVLSIEVGAGPVAPTTVRTRPETRAKATP